MPFKMVGGECVDDTPVHKAIREALANCLINADYHGVRGVVIRKEEEKIIFANPGYVRTGKKQMRLGGESDPRNKSLMKMFNLINIGERAGSGVPKKATKKSDEKKRQKKVTKKRQGQYEKILTFMKPNVWYKASDLMNVLGVKETRTKELLRALIRGGKLIDDGATKGKRYKKAD